jgi:2-oxoglutarate dehydrogenase E1 component
VFCSGKIYHDLVARARAESALPKTLIVRLEELYPFPVEQLREVLTNLLDCKSFLWVQEEHENMGAWRYVEPLFRRLLGVDLEYVGREEAASTADGSGSFHARQQARIVAAALKL